MKESVMVSACLLGVNCRYDGGSKPVAGLKEILKDYTIIPFCPEGLAKLEIPRPPAEIQNGTGEDVLEGLARVINRNQEDCSEKFINGAYKTVELFERKHPKLIIFKANSPSCGVGKIYDGSFSGRLREGNGVTAALLLRQGAMVVTENEFLANWSRILDRK